MPYEPTPLLVFLAVVACEARVGLCLLVSVLRQGGNDNILKVSQITFEGF